jgi:hypothetical protein
MTMSDGETTYLWGDLLDWCGLEYETREEAEESVPGVDPFSNLDDESARLSMEEATRFNLGAPARYWLVLGHFLGGNDGIS